MRIVLLLLCVLFLLIGGVLGYANQAPVSVDLLAGQFELPLIVWMLIVFAAGVLLTALVGGIRQWALLHRCRRAEKRLAAVENELRHLRQISSPASVAKSKPVSPAKAIATSS